MWRLRLPANRMTNDQKRMLEEVVSKLRVFKAPDKNARDVRGEISLTALFLVRITRDMSVSTLRMRSVCWRAAHRHKDKLLLDRSTQEAFTLILLVWSKKEYDGEFLQEIHQWSHKFFGDMKLTSEPHIKSSGKFSWKQNFGTLRGCQLKLGLPFRCFLQDRLN